MAPRAWSRPNWKYWWRMRHPGEEKADTHDKPLASDVLLGPYAEQFVQLTDGRSLDNSTTPPGRCANQLLEDFAHIPKSNGFGDYLKGHYRHVDYWHTSRSLALHVMQWNDEAKMTFEEIGLALKKKGY